MARGPSALLSAEELARQHWAGSVGWPATSGLWAGGRAWKRSSSGGAPWRILLDPIVLGEGIYELKSPSRTLFFWGRWWHAQVGRVKTKSLEFLFSLSLD